jgi:hypothetical protein
MDVEGIHLFKMYEIKSKLAVCHHYTNNFGIPLFVINLIQFKTEPLRLITELKSHQTLYLHRVFPHNIFNRTY